MKVFVLSPNANILFSDRQRKILKEAAHTTFISTVKPLKKIDALFRGNEPRILALDPDFCNWELTSEIIDSIPNLTAICLLTTAYDWVDIKGASKWSIPVTNTSGFSTEAVAEWATLITLALARKLPVIIKDGWHADYVKHRGIELRGRVAGIIGLGRIGRAYADDMAGLGMNVQYWSKNSRDNRYKLVELPELMRSSDVVFLSLASNPDTAKLLTNDLIRSMRSTTIFVAISNNLFDPGVVLQMVKKHELFGFGFEAEASDFGDYPGNVWNGPALAWATEETVKRNAELWVESIVAATRGDYPTRVNGAKL